MKSKWAIGATMLAASLVLVLVFQSDALHASPDSFTGGPDIPSMRLGYVAAQQHGTAHWWFGKWINEASPYFRPVASYLHYAQFVILDSYGPAALTFCSLAVYALLCTLSGLVAWQITGRTGAAFVTIAATAYLHCFTGWLAYFPCMDGLSSVLFQVAAVAAFLAFVRRPRRHAYLVVSWIMFMLSVLCKEAGAFTPLIIGAVVLGLPDLKPMRVVAGYHLSLMLAAGAVILKYGRAMLGRHGSPLLIKDVWINAPGSTEFWLTSAGACLVAVALLAFLYPALFGTRPRRAAWFAATAAGVAASISLSPNYGVGHSEYALFYLVDNAKAVSDGAFQIMAFVGLSWAMVKYQIPLLAAFVCFLLARWPFVIAGNGVGGARIVFLIPYAALCIGALYSIVAGRMTPNNQSSASLQSYPDSLSVTVPR